VKVPPSLKVRGFPRLLLSYTINELGDSVGIVALAFLVYEQTDSALATAALFLAGKFVPAFLSPVAVARLDRLPVRRVLPAIYVAEAAVFAALAVSSEDFLLVLVLALALVDGTLALAGRGLTRGAVGALAQPAGVLRSANALLNVGFAVASVGGAALGGLLVDQVGVDVALWVDAASFAVIAMLLAGDRHLPQPAHDPAAFRERLRAGLAHVRSTTSVRTLVTAEALALVLFTIVVPIEVVYARESLDTDAAGFGLLLSAWGAGIVIGSLVHVRIAGRAPLVAIAGSTLVIGGAYLGMAAAGTLALACAISVVGGAGNGIQWVSVVTALQERTPTHLHARVMGLLESVNAAAPGIGFLLGGVLASLAGPREAFAIAGGGLVLLVALAALRLRGRDSPAAAV